jgi:putative toxin-antitoxin system antitoxin component (TIGR02293 family)
MTTATEQVGVASLEDLQSLPQAELIEAISRGLPAKLARELAARLDLSQDQVASLLRLTPRTLQRRLEEGRLELAESERLWELARLFFQAVRVLESEPAAGQWFKSPLQVLGWKTPLAWAHTAVGLREVENVLGRIEHGVFS